jgi:hypothetical protein
MFAIFAYIVTIWHPYSNNLVTRNGPGPAFRSTGRGGRMRPQPSVSCLFELTVCECADWRRCHSSRAPTNPAAAAAAFGQPAVRLFAALILYLTYSGTAGDNLSDPDHRGRPRQPTVSRRESRPLEPAIGVPEHNQRKEYYGKYSFLRPSRLSVSRPGKGFCSNQIRCS